MIIEEKIDTNNNKILLVSFSKDIFRNNIYYEICLNLVSKNFFNIFKIILKLLQSYDELKYYLLNNYKGDLSKIPIKIGLHDFLYKWKESGGQIYLVSSLNKKFIKNLNLPIDKVFDFQNQYIENVENYSNLNTASEVHAFSKDTSTTFANIDINIVELKKEPFYINDFIKQLRPKQWTKNLLVFSPILLLQEFEWDIFINCFYAFLILSYFASCVYIFNDLLDLESDRNNATKNNRPLAAGKVSLVFCLIMLPFLLLFGVSNAYFFTPNLFPMLIFYLVLSIAYSTYLKRKVLIDVFVLASLFTIRLIIGANAAFMAISFWILAFSIFIFLALASIKRFSEKSYIHNLKQNNSSGRGYEIEDIQTLEYIGVISSFAACIVFASYINTTEVINLVTNVKSLWVICIIILYWLLRLNLIAKRREFAGDPLDFSLSDRVSYICLFLIIFFYINGNANFLVIF